jgi:histidine triad (HIT) family protein
VTEPALCPFCEIIAGRAPAQMVREWPDAVAFIPLNPVAPPPGHVLVVPREHVPDAVTHTDVTVQTMARAVELATAHEASNILTSVGKAATQSVFHLHIHVIRRTDGDQLMVPWGTTGDPHAPHWCRVADEQRQHAVRAEWERDEAHNAVTEARAALDRASAELAAAKVRLDSSAATHTEHAKAITNLSAERDEARQRAEQAERRRDEHLADLEEAERVLARVQRMCHVANIPPVHSPEAALARRILDCFKQPEVTP